MLPSDPVEDFAPIPQAGIDISHIPYKGGTQAIPDLVAGRVTMMFSAIQTVSPLAREGKLRA